MAEGQPRHARGRGRVSKFKNVEIALTDEQTNMHDAGGCGHIELDILQACGLGSRPVDTSTRCPGGHIRRVDDQVANLAVKVVYRNPVQVF